MEKLILIGGGGHCCSCIDVIESTGLWKIEAIVDLPEKKGKKVLNYQINACDQDLPGFVNEGFSFLITIGQIKTSLKRKEIFEELNSLNASLPVIIAPTAYVSPYAVISEGSIILHQAMVNAGAIVGRNCIINTKALLEHDSEISDHCHIATGAVVNGGVKVGEGAFVGSHAVTREYIEIGEQVVVGAGARVLIDVQDHQTVI